MLLNKTISGHEIKYGDWGYGLQTPIADDIKKRIDILKLDIEGSSGLHEQSRILIASKKAQIEILEEYRDHIYEVEHLYSSLINNKVHENSQWGYDG